MTVFKKRPRTQQAFLRHQQSPPLVASILYRMAPLNVEGKSSSFVRALSSAYPIAFSPYAASRPVRRSSAMASALGEGTSNGVIFSSLPEGERVLHLHHPWEFPGQTQQGAQS